MLRPLIAVALLSGCSNLVIVRGSSSDFLKKKATTVTLNAPPDWVGKNLISGRDETEVVSWVLNGLYERLKH